MIGRVTEQSRILGFQRQNASSQAMLGKYNRQISSGLLFERPSESPPDVSTLLNSQRRVARIDQFSRNATNAQHWLAGSDQALQNVNDALTRARTLTVQGLNNGGGSITATAGAAEIRRIREELLAVANTTVAGVSIFSGTAGGKAYDEDGTYLGNLEAVNRSIDTYEVFAVNQTGPDVFGVSDPADLLAGTIFERLDAIATALETGDRATAEAGLTAIDGAMARVHSAQVTVGATVNRIDASQYRLEDERLSTLGHISQIQHADVANALVSLRAAESSYEALLATTGRSMTSSLLNFMR